MSSVVVLTALGVSRDVWNSVSQEDREKIRKAVVQGQIDLAKKMLAKATGIAKPAVKKGNPRNKDVFEKLLKIGKVSEWFGLVSGYSLIKIADKANLWGVTGSALWPKEALKTVIDPYQKYALQQGLDETTIDKALQYFASKAKVDINQVRRVFYQIEVEPKEKPEKLAEEAEKELESEGFEVPEAFVEEEEVEEE